MSMRHHTTMSTRSPNSTVSTPRRKSTTWQKIFSTKLPNDSRLAVAAAQMAEAAAAAPPVAPYN